MDKKVEALLEKVSEQFITLQNQNPPTYQMEVWGMYDLTWQIFINEVFGGKEIALTWLEVEQRVRVAIENENGYVPTPVSVGESANGYDVVEWYNANILGLTETETNEIVMSTGGFPVLWKETREALAKDGK